MLLLCIVLLSGVDSKCHIYILHLMETDRDERFPRTEAQNDTKTLFSEEVNAVCSSETLFVNIW